MATPSSKKSSVEPEAAAAATVGGGGEADHDQANDEDIMASIRSSLVDAIRHRKNRSEQQGEAVRVKLEFGGEKRSIEMKRPVDYEALCAKLRQMYGRTMTMFYTAANSEIIIPVRGQDDLNKAVELLDRTQPGRSLRLILSRLSITPEQQAPKHIPAEAAAPTTEAVPKVETGRYSPPPGTVPDHESDMGLGMLPMSHSNRARHHSRASTAKSEGEFIPEFEEPRIREVPYAASNASSRCSSSRMSVGSSGMSHRRFEDFYEDRPRPHLPLEEIPSHRAPRFSSRSTISDRSTHHHDLLSSKGNTFPSRSTHHGPLSSRPPFANWEAPSGTDGGSAGGGSGSRRTFLRHMRSQPLSRMSAGGSSTSYGASRASSSSESGMVPDICESPECRYCGVLAAMSPNAPVNWRLGRCLGSGAFGQVYLCYDEDTGRELAVKRVLTSAHNPSQEKEVRTLENEITLLRALHNERVVQYIGCQRDGDSLCIFIEYMPGGSVKDEIRQYGPLKEVVAHKYTHQILEGLNYLHHRDIVHRDIKSANILRDTNGNVKIGDFGAGKRLQTICSQSAAAGTFTGTPYYMAPEVISGKNYGRKADIWSLACTIVEMLTGSPPWKDLEPMPALFKIATEQPKYDLPRNTSVHMEEFIVWLFTWDPEKRPTAREALRNPFMACY